MPAPDDWANVFGDATVAAAMLDRLLHRAAVVGIDGPSYRLIQVLVFGCGYRKIVDERCSATTIRTRRNEWIAAGLFEQVEQVVLERTTASSACSCQTCRPMAARPSPGKW